MYHNGVCVRISYLPLFGVFVEMSIQKRLFIYTLGILPYYVLIGIYHMIVQMSSPIILFRILILPSLTLIIEAVLSKLLSQKYHFFRKIAVAEFKYDHIIFVWAIVGVFIGLSKFFSI